jgi:hypothetical protein
MRLFGKILIALLAAVGGFVLLLPSKMAEDVVVHAVTEFAIRKLGIEVPVIETIITDAWLVTPWLAMCGVLYLHNLVYTRMVIRQTMGPVREVSQVTRTSIR